MLRVGVIGYGCRGPNLVGNFIQTEIHCAVPVQGRSPVAADLSEMTDEQAGIVASSILEHLRLQARAS